LELLEHQDGRIRLAAVEALGFLVAPLRFNLENPTKIVGRLWKGFFPMSMLWLETFRQLWTKTRWFVVQSCKKENFGDIHFLLNLTERSHEKLWPPPNRDRSMKVWRLHIPSVMASYYLMEFPYLSVPKSKRKNKKTTTTFLQLPCLFFRHLYTTL